jgi:hypothetical protein
MEGNQPLPKSLSFPKTGLIKSFKRTILFSNVEKSSDYVFWDVNLPTVLKARGCKLGNSFIVHI